MSLTLNCVTCIDAGSGSMTVTFAAGGISALAVGVKLSLQRLRPKIFFSSRKQNLNPIKAEQNTISD